MAITVQSTLYGGTIETYLLEAEAAIQKGVVFLKEALSKQDVNCQKVFFSLLEMFGQIRNQIAHDSNSEAKDCFGKRRDANKSLVRSFTYLELQYLGYGDRFKTLLGKYLPQLMEGKEPKVGDANCQVHFRTYDFPDSEKIDKILDPLLFSSGMSGTTTMQKIILLGKQDPEFMQKIRQASEKEYELIDDFLKTKAYLQESRMTREMFSLVLKSNRLRFIAAKVYWIIQGKLVPVTEFVCLYDAALSSEDAVKAMKKNPKVVKDLGNGEGFLIQNPCILIRHMDKELIDPCLQRVAEIFVRIVMRKSPDEKTLKNDLAEMRYQFSYIMPFDRGSAAVGNWFEKTLSSFHGFHSELPKGAMGDFEAFSKPFFPVFQEKYSELLKLTPSK